MVARNMLASERWRPNIGDPFEADTSLRWIEWGDLPGLDKQLGVTPVQLRS